MNKHTELSDFEINKNVFIKLYGEESLKDKDMFNSFYRTDYCHNPEDAMTIIIENKISLLAGDSNFWCARYGEWTLLPHPSGIEFIEKAQVINDSPYRAAMELFLLMKDAERETNT
ncbi:phage protein NinX family protein [Proteus sp. G2671]|uniref:phage protein NinX family protein n=1 Tax=Proteus sp. G2671 TaxID=2698883 RepID=UPI001378F79D|nr:phage protein NinX family protein [Proteus sp. G2671]NBM04309.1 DUF2591 domain-containing protein [Proteus sp. G2671]